MGGKSTDFCTVFGLSDLIILLSWVSLLNFVCFKILVSRNISKIPQNMTMQIMYIGPTETPQLLYNCFPKNGQSKLRWKTYLRGETDLKHHKGTDVLGALKQCTYDKHLQRFFLIQQNCSNVLNRVH